MHTPTSGSTPTPFEREIVRHEFRVRHLTVACVKTVAPAMLRVTLTGEELEGFTSFGAADHIKIFFPGADGEIVAPTIVDGKPQRPSTGTPVSRDYTPYEFRAGDETSANELDIDFYLHGPSTEADTAAGDGGAAARWAAKASPGDPIVIAGPRGSKITPTGLDSIVIVADETALPATARLLMGLGDTRATCLLTVADPETYAYLAEHERHDNVDLRWFSGTDAAASIEAALRELEIGERTFVFAAGEATSLIPVRRYLRRELSLPKEQVDVQGYWKLGTVGHDHHAPVDPTDTDD